MSELTTRRGFISLAGAVAGAAALPIAAVAQPAVSSAALSPDPLIGLVTEWRRVWTSLNGHDPTDEEETQWGNDVRQIEETIIATDAKTAAGALAVLEVVREDFLQFNFHGEEPSLGDRFTLSGLDKALTALRASLAGGSNG